MVMMKRKEQIQELFKRESWLVEEIEELGKVLNKSQFLAQLTERIRCSKKFCEFSLGKFQFPVPDSFP